MASQITSLTIVYSTVYSDQTKHQSSESLAFVRGIYRWPVNSPHKWPVTRNMFPFDDVIMTKRNKPFSYLMGYACQTRRGRMLVAGPGRWLICLACCPAKCSINSETYGSSLEYIHHKKNTNGFHYQFKFMFKSKEIHASNRLEPVNLCYRSVQESGYGKWVWSGPVISPRE